MKKLSITVQRDSAMERYLKSLSYAYHVADESSESVCFSYGGFVPPLAKISELLALFEPEQYTISKTMTGTYFIVWPNE